MGLSWGGGDIIPPFFVKIERYLYSVCSSQQHFYYGNYIWLGWGFLREGGHGEWKGKVYIVSSITYYQSSSRRIKLFLNSQGGDALRFQLSYCCVISW